MSESEVKVESKPTEAQGLLDQIKQFKAQAEEELKAIQGSRTKTDEIATVVLQAKASSEQQSKLAAELKDLFAVELNSIKQIRIQAEEKLKATEAARKKADDDASYASQAKVNTEEHSKATAIFKGTAEAELSSIVANKKNFEELVATATVGKAAFEADVKTVSEGRKAVEQAAGEIVEAARKGTIRLQEIDSSKNTAEAALKQSTEASRKTTEELELANNERLRVEATKAKVDKLSETAETLATSIEESHTLSSERSSEIAKLLVSAKESEVSLAKVLEHLAKSEGIASGYETRVAELSNKLEALNARAEGLLPGFTSTGLSYSFNEQKKRFTPPQERWLRTFIWCIVGLGVVAMPSFVTAIIGAMYGTKPEEWGLIFRSLAMRLPIVIPLVWLAIYAGRNYMLSIRLEEDYAYKESLSKAFEGYKREMMDIPVEDISKNPTPLNTLCVNVLSAIAERPGRIYDGKHKDISIYNEAHGAAEKVLDLSKKQLASQ